MIAAGEPLPVGAYVLDKSRLPVPVGVIGEIYLSGLQVMEGYIDKDADYNQARLYAGSIPTWSSHVPHR